MKLTREQVAVSQKETQKIKALPPLLGSWPSSWCLNWAEPSSCSCRRPGEPITLRRDTASEPA